jgi:hypothetical protein
MANSVKVSSWDNFKSRVDKLRTTLADNPELAQRLLFRGQADANWRLNTTLDRVGGASMRFSDYYRKICLAQFQIESFTSNRWDIPDYPELSSQTAKYDFLHINRDLHSSIYSYLTHLRHHGFPTPILDWSRSLYVASYFAFANARDVDEVSIYVLSEANMHCGGSGTPCLTCLGPYVQTHKRHFIQQCEYTMSMIYNDNDWYMTPHEHAVSVGDTLEFADTEFPDNFAVCKFDLPASERKNVLRRLDEHNVNAFTLFGSEESLMETLAIRQFEFED